MSKSAGRSCRSRCGTRSAPGDSCRVVAHASGRYRTCSWRWPCGPLPGGRVAVACDGVPAAGSAQPATLTSPSFGAQQCREVTMKQRVPRRTWQAPGRAGRRSRVLIEDGHPALAISDFSLFEQAGLDVAFCSGPGDDGAACPVLRGQRCPLVAGADAVLHGLDPALGIAAVICRQRPGLPVVAEQRRRADGSLEPVPEGCTPLTFPCSVRGQIDALRRALAPTVRPGSDARGTHLRQQRRHRRNMP
jgi:hypothetical protein